jgi:hypothetical protein
MSNALASLLQARPCPTFGRPVHPWGSPLDYGPVLLLMPFGFHLKVDTLPSRELRAMASGPPWLYPTFVFVPVYASPYLSLSPASDALPPLLDTALLIRALEGLQPSRSMRCSAQNRRLLIALRPSLRRNYAATLPFGRDLL